MTERGLQQYYNEASNITAKCHSNKCWARGECPELEIGKVYQVSHIGVLSSSTNIILSEFPMREYNSSCFSLYENGEQLAKNYTDDPRFWAPYIREESRGCIEFDEQIETMTIPAHLRCIEKEYGVKILLAVESGSKVWGFESSDSDWDVRFVYVHKPEWYFKVDEQRDVIEHIYNDDVDLAGWELRKALSLLKRGNVSLLEWLNSPKVYYADNLFVERMSSIGKMFFNPIKAMYHYNRIYNKHNERYLQKEDCNMKRFLYYLRGVLACKWIETYKTLPPVRFEELLEATVRDSSVKKNIYLLIEIKRDGRECDINIIDKNVLDYTQQLACYYNGILDTFRPEQECPSTETLDTMLYDMVKMQWEIKRFFTISPDCTGIMLLDDEGCAYPCDEDTLELCIDKDENYVTINIPGIYQWQQEFERATDFAETTTKDDFDWGGWHKRGIELAKQLRAKLPKSCDLWYDAPFEDKSGTIKEKFLVT